MICTGSCNRQCINQIIFPLFSSIILSINTTYHLFTASIIPIRINRLHRTFGIQELIRTGSADHNMWLAVYAISKGYRLKYSTGLMKDNIAVAGVTEESVFAALGLPCPVPEKREIVNGKPLWEEP